MALEEGGLELSNMWSDPEQQIEAQNDTPVQIGSIRLVVCVSGIKVHLYLPASFQPSRLYVSIVAWSETSEASANIPPVSLQLSALKARYIESRKVSAHLSP